MERPRLARSGSYVVPEALAPLHIDLAAGMGTCAEPTIGYDTGSSFPPGRVEADCSRAGDFLDDDRQPSAIRSHRSEVPMRVKRRGCILSSNTAVVVLGQQ